MTLIPKFTDRDPSEQNSTLPLMLLSLGQLREIGIDLARESIWRLEAANRFPRRVYLSKQKVFWIKSEIYEWLEQRSAEREHRVYRTHD